MPEPVTRPAAPELVTVVEPGDPRAEPERLLEQVRAGRIFVVRGALQHIGCFDELRRLALESIAETAGPELAARVGVEGFEGLHRGLSGPQVYDAYVRLTERLRGVHRRVVSGFVRGIAGHRGALYAGEKIWVRFFVPHDRYAENRRQFSTRVGHLRTQNPHRDSWSTNPTNALVLWLAMGRVVHGNSMIVYPRQWGRPVAHPDYERRGLRIDASHPLGVPVTFALEPGDALVFCGEHLHSSEVNVTEETRFALTFRFAVEPPRYGEGNRWYPYADTALLSGPLAALADWRSRATVTYLRYLLFWRLGYWLRQRLLPRRRAVRQPLTQPAPATACSLPELAVGEVRPLDADRAVARTEQGVFAFSRRCPHEGADLAQGYLRDGRIHCAWHNVGFDLADGSSPCGALAKIRVQRVTQP